MEGCGCGYGRTTDSEMAGKPETEVIGDIVLKHPELARFVISNVRPTGKRIGTGAYGSVMEVAIPGAICAAKQIHDVLQGVTGEASDNVSPEFIKECKIMSSLRHPHIVQFLGICILPVLEAPTAFIVMESMHTSLHDLLAPAQQLPKSCQKFIPLSLKRSILHDVASGLIYLHEQSIVHRDLSARSVLLNAGMVAKIADLGMACIVVPLKSVASMTKAPGANVYMPPEALEGCPRDPKQKANYDSSIDVFSFGVLSMFTLSQTFPCELLSPKYLKDKQLTTRTELERRNKYMLIIYSQFRENHPLIQMIEKCLDFPDNRPSIRGIMDMLEEAKAEDKDETVEMNILELYKALEAQKVVIMC